MTTGARSATTTSIPQIDVPVLNLAGWFDAYAGAAFINFDGMVQRGRTPAACRSQKLLIGPWPHDLASSTVTGQMDFGSESKIDLLALELRWFDYWLKGIDTGIMDEPAIRSSSWARTPGATRAPGRCPRRSSRPTTCTAAAAPATWSAMGRWTASRRPTSRPIATSTIRATRSRPGAATTR